MESALRLWSRAHFANNNNNTDNNSSDDDNNDFFAEMTIDSVIIDKNGFYLCHLKQFLAPAVGNISHWKICYRASKHGRYDFIFHQRCNGKNNTLTIIKKDEYVFGGFTDISWGNKFALSVVTKNLKECFCFCFFHIVFLWKRKETCTVSDERQP